MIDADKCSAILALHQEGMGLRELSRRLRLGRNTARRILRRQGRPPTRPCGARVHLDPERLQALYKECDGRAQRVHEKLVEEEGLKVTYPTLTRRLRELGISAPAKSRCDQVPDEPGAEMQHDTTVYTIKLNETPARLVASLQYLRYSKRRYSPPSQEPAIPRLAFVRPLPPVGLPPAGTARPNLAGTCF